MLHCPFCGHDTPIEDTDEEIREYPFEEALHLLAQDDGRAGGETVVACPSCGATFSFDDHTHAGNCPFCGTPIVTRPGDRRPLTPRSLIPFQISREQAVEAFRRWLAGLWFAPSRLKKQGAATTSLQGVYIPYWTYDSQTITRYQGERGIAYQVPERVMVMENGRQVVRTRMVTRIRWQPVAGQVSRFFDDVLVGATRTLPRTITDNLRPWDMAQLVPYNDAYLAGFESEMYQVRLDEGFDVARKRMEQIIRNDVARDIGGDFQRIHHLDTRYEQVTFKHLLLPVWSAAFTFGGKRYRFVVNGQTGKVRGERPYSPWKIALAIAAGLLLAGGIAYLYQAGYLR